MGSVVANWQVNGANPVTVGGTGTTAKYFLAPSGNFTSGVAPLSGPTSSAAYGQLPLRGDNEFNGQRFAIQASGDFEVGPGGACPSVTFDLQANTGTLASPTYTTIATSGAVTAQTNLNTFYPWSMSVEAVGTTAAGTLSGTQNWTVDNTQSVSNGVLTNVLSGLDFSGATSKVIGTVLGLVMRVTFSVSEPGNLAHLYQFQITAV